MSNSLDQGATARTKNAHPGDNFARESSSQQQQISQSKGYPPIPKDDFFNFLTHHSLLSQQNPPKTDFLPPSSQISDQPQGLHPFNGVPRQPMPSARALPLPQNPPKGNYHPSSFQTSDHSQQQEPLNGIPSHGYSTHDQSHRSSNHPQHQQHLSSPQVHPLKQNPGKNSHHPPTSSNQTSHQSHPKQPPNEVPSETHPTEDHLQRIKPQKQQPPIGVPSQDHPPRDNHSSGIRKDNVSVPSSLNKEQPVSVGSAFPTQGNRSMQQRPPLPADPLSQPQKYEFPMQDHAGVDAQAKGRGAEPVIAFPDPSCLQENLNQLTTYVLSKQQYSLNAQETNQLTEAVPPSAPPPQPSCCCTIL